MTTEQKMQEQIDKLIKAINDIDPKDWNDGCSCCMMGTLDSSYEWKSLMEVVDETNASKQG